MTTEERRAMVARRDPEKVRAADRARYYRNREDRKARMAAWAAANPTRSAALKREWQTRNPEKRAAHVAVGNAIRDGYLIRGCCEVCGEPDGQAHHDDYSRPLDVRWLCSQHHADHHTLVRA